MREQKPSPGDLDPLAVFAALGLTPDPWQRDILSCADRQILINCCRQAGKSTVVSALALHEVLVRERATTLLLSPGQRQSSELFHKVLEGYRALEQPVPPVRSSALRLELRNGSRLISLPGREQTIRGYSPTLLILDEAARVADDLYHAVRPMLAATRGRLVALSTPFGQRGWFYQAWFGAGQWRRFQATWRDCPRIAPTFIEEERLAMGDAWVRQEYECLFTALEGLVYPDFARTATAEVIPPTRGRLVGGIDWGWRNPFAAIWGVLDRDDVLWLQHERYLRSTALHEHAQALPRDVAWYSDPSGPTELREFAAAAGHKIRAAPNAIRPGIAAVTARIRSGRLRVNPARCPNLWEEAKLYRYPSTAARGEAAHENPVDEHNHALAALRYLVGVLDARFMARMRPQPPSSPEPPQPHDSDDHWVPLT